MTNWQIAFHKTNEQDSQEFESQLKIIRYQAEHLKPYDDYFFYLSIGSRELTLSYVNDDRVTVSYSDNKTLGGSLVDPEYVDSDIVIDIIGDINIESSVPLYLTVLARRAAEVAVYFWEHEMFPEGSLLDYYGKVLWDPDNPPPEALRREPPWKKKKRSTSHD